MVHGTLARSEALVRGKKPGPGVGTQGGSRYGSRPEEEFDSWSSEEDPDQGKRSSYKSVEWSTPRSNVSVFGSDQDPSGLRSSKTDPENMDRVRTGSQPESRFRKPAGSSVPVPDRRQSPDPTEPAESAAYPPLQPEADSAFHQGNWATPLDWGNSVTNVL